MRSEIMRREIKEARNAGQMALESLYMAREKLNSARSFGWLDILGGGMLSGLMKHSRMDEAATYMEQAKYNLQAFQRELRDVHVPMDLRMEIGGFLTFADFFFDGVVVDYLVQSRIAEAREQVEQAIRRVEHLLTELDELERGIV